MIELLEQKISVGTDNAAIVESFKQDAKLGLNLIRLVNTAGNPVRGRLESIEDGVRTLGLRQLSRWVSVLLELTFSELQQYDHAAYAWLHDLQRSMLA